MDIKSETDIAKLKMAGYDAFVNKAAAEAQIEAIGHQIFTVSSIQISLERQEQETAARAQDELSAKEAAEKAAEEAAAAKDPTDTDSIADSEEVIATSTGDKVKPKASATKKPVNG